MSILRCPYCGEDMLEGKIKTSMSAIMFDKVYWNAIDNPNVIGGSFSVKKNGGVIINSIPKGQSIAYNCKGCKKIIIDYKV